MKWITIFFLGMAAFGIIGAILEYRATKLAKKRRRTRKPATARKTEPTGWERECTTHRAIVYLVLIAALILGLYAKYLGYPRVYDEAFRENMPYDDCCLDLPCDPPLPVMIFRRCEIERRAARALHSSLARILIPA